MPKPSPRNFAVDVKAVDAELKKRGLERCDASEQMGRTRSYLSKKLSQGVFSPTDEMMFDMLFNIKRDSYELKEEKEEQVVNEQPAQEVPMVAQPQEITVTLEVDYEKLHKTIYDAVYEAARKAFE